ncbi:MAG TPA: FG-GAP-like repeat-containing protein, partial [Polyangia bacterium]|nr:FG-GAP-like repeat-containing protein [Polyangia bacterium]
MSGQHIFRMQMPTAREATCQSRGVCGGGDGDAICLYSDGVVEMSPGHFVAVFGFDNAASTSVQPSVNQVRYDGNLVPSPQPAPPTLLPSGTHSGAYLPTFEADHILAWTINGETVTASASSRRLPSVPLNGGGIGVVVAGTTIVLKAGTDPYDDVPTTEPNVQPEPGFGTEYHGTIPAQLSIGPSGAATYTVPIDVPHGIGGVVPNLSLTYNSQGGNGLAGQGWDLGGLSMIHRCPKTRVQDGSARTVSMESLLDGDDGIPGDGDGVCLDGKRLFESTTEPGKYQSEVKDYTTITRVQGPTASATGSYSFTVVTKSGETRYYGARYSGSSRVFLPHENTSGVDQSTKETAVWLLDRVVDAWGNYFDVHYNNDQADWLTSGIRVTRIDYTGHMYGDAIAENGQSTTPELQQTFHSITFTYENRPDLRRMRFHGASIPSPTRLRAITTPLGTYTLDYLDPDVTLPSRLRQISYCAPHLPLPPSPGVPILTCLDPLQFDWDGGDYHWVDTPAYAPPFPIDSFYASPHEVRSRAGAQFVDLDGDGRTDFVGSMQGSSNFAYRNSGSGWVQKIPWILPTRLFKSTGESAGSYLGDIDGDGLPDLLSSPGASGCVPASGKQLCVWLNRIKSNPACSASQCWVRDDNRASVPASWGAINLEPSAHQDALADVDGDGVVDIARTGPGQYEFKVIVGTPTGFVTPTLVYGFGSTIPGEPVGYHLEDFNHDGLADLVSNNNPSYPATYLGVGINTGVNQPGGCSGGCPVWRYRAMGADPKANAEMNHRQFADVDGDGMTDVVWNISNSDEGVVFGTGTGYRSGGPATAYANSIPTADADSAGFLMTDVNADGLADQIQSVNTGAPTGLKGKVWINNGTSWVDPGWLENGQTDHELDVSPVEINEGAVFLDVDGDGVIDLVQSKDIVGGPQVRHAYLNKFRPPVINKFPNGLAARKTEVAYAVITMASAQGSVYLDDLPLAGRTKYATPPIRVATSVKVENGVGFATWNTTSYVYHSFRTSTNSRGPQGFARIEATDSATGITTRTDYVQYFPYTGLPSKVTRFKVVQGTERVLNETSTGYCNTIAADATGNPLCTTEPPAPGTPGLVYPVKVLDKSYLHVGPLSEFNTPELIQTVTDFRYDDWGNPTSTTVTTTGPDEVYEKKTVNTYGAPGSDEQKQGKITRAVVTSRRVAPGGPTLTHTTAYEYGIVNRFYYSPIEAQPQQDFATLGLMKKKVEPDACTDPTCPQVRVDTAYLY